MYSFIEAAGGENTTHFSMHVVNKSAPFIHNRDMHNMQESYLNRICVA